MTDDRIDSLPGGMFSVAEPTAGDALERDRYARAFARLAAGCGTPMVVGLYGTWGSGKSSLMMRIREKLDDAGIPTVWFDPWRHQFEEEPVIALLQTMMSDLELDKGEDVKVLLKTVAVALGSPLLKAATGVSFKDLAGMASEMADEGLRIRSEQLRLQQNIGELIGKACELKGRMAVFIDDLDRCLPGPMIRMLEALKLYLNAEGCVYFLGIDDGVVRQAIDSHFKVRIEDQQYLDKIIQVPFLIPRVAPETALEYIAGLLPEEARHCAADLVAFLGDNPRQVKRFANNLSLTLLMTPEIFADEDGAYSVDLIVVMLLIQLRNGALWRQIEVNPPLYFELRPEGEDEDPLNQEIFDGDTQLQGLVQRVDCPVGTPMQKYVLLTDVAGASARREMTTSIEPEMQRIGPGTFLMGSPETDGEVHDHEKPQHPVVIERPFSIARYPVTFSEYDAFAEATGRPQPDDRGWGRERRPVINVSWRDAWNYIEWLRQETGRPYRLPTEAEWEYACRAGSEDRYSFGSDADCLGDYAWFVGNAEGQTHPVGERLANAFGLHDMSGNVWEWVEDVWYDTYEEAPADGSAWTEGGEQRYRVLWGGSWNDGIGGLRSAIRVKTPSVNRGGNVGFRLARTLD